MENLKAIVMWYQVSLDMAASLACLYIAVSITEEFGFGSLRERWQYAHRVALGAACLAWAYHALDVAVRPGAHGLTLSNVFLHTVVLSAIVISAVRIWRYQHGANANGFKRGPDGNLVRTHH